MALAGGVVGHSCENGLAEMSKSESTDEIQLDYSDTPVWRELSVAVTRALESADAK